MCEYDKMSSLFTLAKITTCQHEINHPKLFTWMMCYNAAPEPNTVLGILGIQEMFIDSKNEAQV